jgi:hypothetical protein
VFASTPLALVSEPLPVFRSPCQNADAVRFMVSLPVCLRRFSRGSFCHFPGGFTCR